MRSVGSKYKNLISDVIFSWSLDDIINQDLPKVERIPDSFQSVDYYVSSFINPLLEDIRAELSSKMQALPDAPFAQVHGSKPLEKNGMYDVMLGHWRNSTSDEPHAKELFRSLPGPGDIVIFAEDKPLTVSDLERFGRSWCFGYITHVSGDDEAANFKIRASKDIDPKDGRQRMSFVVFLMNITTNKRIWDTLHQFGNSELVKEVLYTDPEDKENCKLCPMEMNETLSKSFSFASFLNETQSEAVSSCMHSVQCNHKSSVSLIWGPPGTGKTRTIGVLLSAFLKLKCRTLTCAPTNVAIIEVASRVVKVVRESSEDIAASVGDILLFGKKDQTISDVEDIHLDYRIDKLAECFGHASGWKRSFTSMISFLEDILSDDKIQACQLESNGSLVSLCSWRDMFRSIALSLNRNVSILCTHLSKSCILARNIEQMESLINFLNSIENLLFRDNLDSEDISRLLCLKDECLRALRTLELSLDELNFPNASNRELLEKFCFRKASLIFCTASSSYKLISMGKDFFQYLVIDEAAQLKECETLIPLQAPGVRHVVLIGDVCQLTAMVNSKVSQDAGFGRSLFERLSILGHPKHLLDTQYRMHPDISFFPNSKFYQNRIVNALNVKSRSYRKQYLPHPMFGPYSFINISGGKEVVDKITGSQKNYVEVAVVLKIVQLLHKACEESNLKITLGVVSPYSAQVAAIQQKLGQKFENHPNLNVKVRSIDGFQGSEEDVIIVSTVRSNKKGSVGFISSLQRTNVALTRARYALWILGNEITLSNSGSIWEEVIIDAKVRQCFFHADEDKDLAKVIFNVKKELNQLEDLLKGDSALFRAARWKLLFSDSFRKSFSKLKSMETKRLALLMLSKLANGWRPRSRSSIGCDNSSARMLQQFKVGDLYIICSIDIVKESWYVQALKVWDILPLQDIDKLVTRLEGVFGMYTKDYLDRCKAKRVEGDLVIPITWPASLEIVQLKCLGCSDSEGADNEKGFEVSKVRDSLLLMKFYSFSSGAVHNMISSCDGGELDLPFELTEQEKEIVSFNRSSFILGRSGTGKTTVLTMKLFQNEQLYHLAVEGFHEVNSDDPHCDANWKHEVSGSDEETKTGESLHQLFVTVSPKLCFAVNQHVQQLKRSICRGKSSAQKSSIYMDDIDETTQFAEIPDSFVDLPREFYPLIITFQKFLLMLDGTVGPSYFDRFWDVRIRKNNKDSKSKSVLLETFIRTKEVSYDKFDSSYWPHFNTKFTRKLDSCTVFTEIMSVIKGGLAAGDAPAGKLCQEDYVSLAQNRSSLSLQKREMVYHIYLEYEKKKTGNGEFDMADLVLDLHHRLKDKRYEGDEMDFVYIDEVQDLSMRQIALFKYICKNVDEGFAFSGDTAQTIAKGINFRFEDIRHLFYKEFFPGSRMSTGKQKEGKGKISRIFQLSQNFRTHAAVLKLAQSVINLLYCFFPSSIDVVSPETSPLSGETPVLVRTEDSRSALKTIFEKSGDAGGRFIGFGAEQVILVRDESMKKEIGEYVGRRALVLTITECKGLEFQDVLLYNFFSSSSMKDPWRVIYGYMIEKSMLNSDNVHVANFDQEKHNGLCSEMKLLYVAITRTKQRLWIFDECIIPMFEYWNKLCLVQERTLDESFVKEMQVDSSKEEWMSRGIKLYYEHNYEMALMCFERAGDTFWERLAHASGLRATADRFRASDSAKSNVYFKKAAELFYSIGKAELAAQCFLEIKDYERAGMIYLENVGETKLEKAGECFCMANCFKLAAEAYARGRLYSKSLSACLDGKLFEMGFQYLESWKQYEALQADRKSFLHRGALHYFELNQHRNMMKFVKCFDSNDSMRNFLKDLNCLDELLLLEEEWGNFLEAANIARLKKYDFREADLLEKAGLYREASTIFLWYVFSNFLSLPQGKYKPLRQKDELLKKAKIIARNDSEFFYELVCMLADILSKGRTIKEDPEMALEFVQLWKKDSVDLERVKTRYEVGKLEQDLLRECASHFHHLNDTVRMMKYVEAFKSVESKRSFLKYFNCLDELLELEELEGNFLIAAKIAKQKGDVLREFDLLEKAKYFKEASELMLLYVMAKSLWEPAGSKGWPLKEFTHKEELLEKAVSCAEHYSDRFHEIVTTEAKVLSGQRWSLSKMRECLISSQRNCSCIGEILSARNILEAHLCISPDKYDWDFEPIDNLMSHSEPTSSQNHASVNSLVSIWNNWKENIVKGIDCFRDTRIGTNDDSDFTRYREFFLQYLGLRDNRDAEYAVLTPDASWLKEIDSRSVQKKGELVFVGAHSIKSAAEHYWTSELLSVCNGVLGKLESLHKYSTGKQSLFHQCITIVYMFEVAKFLENYKFQNKLYSHTRSGEEYLQLCTHSFLEIIFHMDWRKSSTQELLSLRGSRRSVNLLKEAISRNSVSNSTLTFGMMGRAMMTILGSSRQMVDLYENTVRSIAGNSMQREFFEKLYAKNNSIPTLGSYDPSLVLNFCNILKDTFAADWRIEVDYISPSCFIYLLERLMILASSFQGYFFTSKSSCLEWLIHEEWSVASSGSVVEMSSVVEDIHNFMAFIVSELLLNKQNTVDWIKQSNIHSDDYYLLLALRLVTLLGLVCVNSAQHFNTLFNLLGRSDVQSLLPKAFCDVLLRVYGRRFFVHALADAFEKVGNPLVLVSLTENLRACPCPEIIFLNSKSIKLSKDSLKDFIFREKDETVTSCSDDQGRKFEVESTSASDVVHQDQHNRNHYGGANYGVFWEIFDTSLELLENQMNGCIISLMSNVPIIKVEVDRMFYLLYNPIAHTPRTYPQDDDDLFMEAESMLDELKQLSSFLDISRFDFESIMPDILELSERLRARRPRLESFLVTLLSPST